jgi:hypothetical protein
MKKTKTNCYKEKHKIEENIRKQSKEEIAIRNRNTQPSKQRTVVQQQLIPSPLSLHRSDAFKSSKIMRRASSSNNKEKSQNDARLCRKQYRRRHYIHAHEDKSRRREEGWIATMTRRKQTNKIHPIRLIQKQTIYG